MKRFSILLCTALLVLSLAGMASAFGLSSVASGVSGGDDSPKADIKGLNSEQAKLKSRLVSALVHMLDAQGKVLDATGDKDAAGKVANQVESLKKGNVQDEEIDKSVALTEENNKAISEKESSMSDLDKSSKQKLAKALPPYAMGVVDMTKLSKDFTNWLDRAQSAVSSASPASLLSVKDNLAFGLDMAPKIPAICSQTLSTTQKLIAFCKQNKLETSGAEEALGDL
ncbi:hypothetical protein [Maridesulfovibrio hydrothermalis]|uniref:Uncharacterized protein n=1 Tax=Maridesulfovibrio hydrothermalis AM13 = DSM 14728 TaxID=1121451 RepID=L0RCH3_9BACT|nr:hypothetical protein [Maridesulfovibrio hydrothermalis]CCO23281.1 exported protein of unknown function [Maridesulfovibrio hydrothermalis AM13 = DSM 14728]